MQLHFELFKPLLTILIKCAQPLAYNKPLGHSDHRHTAVYMQGLAGNILCLGAR